MKILVAIPCNNYVETQCIESLFKIAARIREWCELDVRTYSGYSCEQARNKAMGDMINSDAEYLFFVDSDIVLQPNSLEKLLIELNKSTEYGLISGIYFKKQNCSRTAEICYVNNNGCTIFFEENQIPETVFKIDGCGFGCVLIKRSVCEHLYNVSDKRPFVYLFDPLISEDLWFCNLASNNGYTILCHPEVRCGHIWKQIY